MKKYAAILFVMIAARAAFAAGPDNYAPNAGATLPHNHTTLVLDGVYGNPALLGLNSTLPRYGLSVLPISVAIWSDKLSLPIDRHLLENPFNFQEEAARYLVSRIEEGFESPNPNIGLTDGLMLYGGWQFTPVAFAARGFGFNLRTYASAEASAPGGFLRRIPNENAPEDIVFEDISGLSVNAIWATELVFSLGYSLTLPAIKNALGLDRGAAGMSMRLIAGHNYFKGETVEGSAALRDTLSGMCGIDAASVDITSIGSSLYDYSRRKGEFLFGNTISGLGFGLDLGTAFHNRNHFLSFDIRDIGAILWDGNQVYKYRQPIISGDSPNANNLSEVFDDIFGDIFDVDVNTLEPANKTHTTWLPMSLNAGYSFHYDLSKVEEIHFLLGYVTAGANIRQQLILGPGRNTYVPRLALGAAFGTLAGYFPLRYGLIVGGPENLASSFGLGLDIQNASFDVSYKAVGSPLLTSKNGFEAAASGTFRWGRTERKPKPRKEPRPEPPLDPEPVEDQPEPEPPEEEWIIDETAEEIVEEIVEESLEEEMRPVEIVLTILPQPTAEERREFRASQNAINFRSGGYDLTPGSFPALDRIAETLKQYPHIRYEIQGHTDSQGGVLNNMLLSTQRALVVKNYLIAKGAPETGLIAIGYGPHKPIADNNTVRGRALNRRVEFVQIESQEQFDELKRREMETMKDITRQVFEGRQGGAAYNE